MQTTDHELIYLIRSESLQSAFKILFSRYFNNLVKATMNYYFRTFRTSFSLEYDEIKSICYSNFLRITNEFDLKTNKFNFKQYLFIVNRSRVRDLIYKQIHKLGNKTLTNSYSLDRLNPKLVDWICRTNNETSLKLRILIKEILKYIETIINKILNDNELKLFKLWFNGCSIKSMCQITNLECNKINNIIKNATYKINKAIIFKFNLGFNKLPGNFCKQIQIY